jgi:hypothetical protein
MSRRPAAYLYQFSGIHRLHAETDPAESGLKETAQSFLSHGIWMRFKRHLGMFLKSKALLDLFQYGGKLIAAQCCRSATAEVHSVE